MKKIRSRLNHYFAIIFVALISVVMIINLIVPDRDKSISENRSLQKFPTFDMQEVLSGDYESTLNSWYSDQFVGRNFFVHFKYVVSKMTGMKKMDDVYLGKDMLIEDASESNSIQLKRNLEAINAFYEKYPDINHYFLLAPNSISVQSDRLPKNVETTNQNEQMDQIYQAVSGAITKLDVRGTLEQHKDEYLYYRSDHHWTSLGAFYAFSSACSYMGLGSSDEGDYKVYSATKNFKGTLANKTGSLNMKDEIELYVSKELPDYVITNVSSGKASRTMYSSEGLNSSDPYTVFTGGNAGLIRLEMDNNSNKRLLLFKDSYANTFLQFLIPHYRTITIVDPRYYFDDIDRIVQKEVITDVMYMYNTNTFVQDTSLADVIE